MSSTRRDISEAEIKNTLLLPKKVIKSSSGGFIAQRIYNRYGRKMLLRVFFEKHNGSYVVITAYWTSKISKYFPRSSYESSL